MSVIKTSTILCTVFLVMIMSSCSRKNYAAKNSSNGDQEATVYNKQQDRDYSPPPVVYVADGQAKTNKNGEMYYDNEYGYRYWRFCDGKYYLDAKYDKLNNESMNRPATKYKKSKKSKKKKHDEYEDED